MKKIFLLIVLLVGFVTVQAQIVGQYVSFVNDTTTDAETEYMVLATPVAITANYVGAIEISGTNSSGTATVTAALQVSDDNTLWYNYGSSITLNNAGTVSNYAWQMENTAFKYYRIRCISTGTGVTAIKGKIGLKKH